MNKQDIAIVAVLVVALVGWLFHQNNEAKRARAAYAERMAAAATNEVPASVAQPMPAATEAPSLSAGAQTEAPVAPGQGTAASAAAMTAEAETGVEESIVTLSDEEVGMEISSKGGAILSARLSGYRQSVDKDSPEVVLVSSNAPILALEGIPGFGARSDFTVVSSSGTEAVLRAASDSGLTLTRTIALQDGYRVAVTDVFANEGEGAFALGANAVSFGEIRRLDANRLNILSVDALSAVRVKDGSFAKVDHWEKKGRVAAILTGRQSSGGCSGAPDASFLPESASVTVDGPQEWVALKSRFFTQVMSSDARSAGYRITARRAAGQGALKIESVSGALLFDGAAIAPGESLSRSYTLYIGPKKYSVLRHFGPRSGDIMDFGTWKYICVAVLWLLNFLFGFLRNYGLAIIAITILVRVAFWPLTQRSNESMKKMQEIQPLLKEIQAKFKDDPQKLMQEQQAIYRQYKVNPMASCLPMLVQIPFFIAIFFVLRSAVELRFAPFLWIADLSDQENILPGLLPIPINILPLVMAGTMYLQSRLTPSMGDPAQQRMMTLMMPAMMLVMFYTMPSALVLYWSVSQILAIVQLWRRRQGAAGQGTSATAGQVETESMTRQARRLAARGE